MPRIDLGDLRTTNSDTIHLHNPVRILPVLPGMNMPEDTVETFMTVPISNPVVFDHLGLERQQLRECAPAAIGYLERFPDTGIPSEYLLISDVVAADSTLVVMRMIQNLPHPVRIRVLAMMARIYFVRMGVEYLVPGLASLNDIPQECEALGFTSSPDGLLARMSMPQNVDNGSCLHSLPEETNRNTVTRLRILNEIRDIRSALRRE